MDAWMRAPGASVDGHRGAVRFRDGVGQASCSCGRPFLDQATVQGACLVLVLHLSAVVRDRGSADGGDDGGGAGVREPRRPVPSSDSGSVELGRA